MEDQNFRQMHCFVLHSRLRCFLALLADVEPVDLVFVENVVQAFLERGLAAQTLRHERVECDRSMPAL